jgi:hypothetical protein
MQEKEGFKQVLELTDSDLCFPKKPTLNSGTLIKNCHTGMRYSFSRKRRIIRN